MTPTALNAAYATCTPPTQAKIEVTHDAGSAGMPPAIAVSTPASTDTAMAIHRAVSPLIALVLIACTMYGTTSTVTTVRHA